MAPMNLILGAALRLAGTASAQTKTAPVGAAPVVSAQPLAGNAGPAPTLLRNIGDAYRLTLVSLVTPSVLAPNPLAAPYTSRGAAASLIAERGLRMNTRATAIAGELNHLKTIVIDTSVGGQSPKAADLAKAKEAPPVVVDKQGVEHPVRLTQGADPFEAPADPRPSRRAGWLSPKVARAGGPGAEPASNHAPSRWKHLSQDALKVLGALRARGSSDGYQLMAAARLDEEALGRALEELQSFPTTPVITMSGDTDPGFVGTIEAVILPNSRLLVDFLLNKAYQEVSADALTVLSLLGGGAALEGYRLMRDSGLREAALGKALDELAGLALVETAGTTTESRVGGSISSIKPGSQGAVKALLAYRRS